MNLKVKCDNDEGINAMGELRDMPDVPVTGDIIHIDGLRFLVTGREFGVGPDFSDDGVYGVLILLHGEE